MKTGLASLGLNQDDKELLDRFFTSQEFKEIAEKDIGTLIKTIFDQEIMKSEYMAIEAQKPFF